MPADFVQMDLLSWGADPDLAADIGIPITEPEQEFTDGITPDRLETIDLSLPKKIKDAASVSLSCGDSGKWYCGWSAHSSIKQEGCCFAAWPKFSQAYDSKYLAFTAAAEAIEGWLATKTQRSTHKIIIQELKLIAQSLDPEQYERDTTCDEWRTCGYAEQCFSQSLKHGPGPVCFKDQETEKGKEAAQATLAELCSACHAATGCSKCCISCKTPCNAAQNCRWPGVEVW